MKAIRLKWFEDYPCGCVSQVDDIPARRDWLDPDLERVAREAINNARRGM